MKTASSILEGFRIWVFRLEPDPGPTTGSGSATLVLIPAVFMGRARQDLFRPNFISMLPDIQCCGSGYFCNWIRIKDLVHKILKKYIENDNCKYIFSSVYFIR